MYITITAEGINTLSIYLCIRNHKYLDLEKSFVIYAVALTLFMQSKSVRLLSALRLSMKIIMKKKVFVSGCYDLLHSGHVEFFQQASQYGDLYVGIGSDATYLEYKHRKPMFPQEERLFMVKNIKAVKDAYINEGSGVIDFLPTLDKVKPDVFVVNAEGTVFFRLEEGVIERI